MSKRATRIATGPDRSSSGIGAEPPCDRSAAKELAGRPQSHFGRLVRELSEGRPAARLLQASGPQDWTGPSRTDGVIAHELRQPLFAIGMASENLRLLLDRDELDRDTMRCSVMRIAEQVQQAQAIIEQTLLSASRRASAEVPCSPHGQELASGNEAADVAQGIRRTIRQFDSIAQDRDILFSCQLSDKPLVADIAPIELEQVLVNLVRNAMESIGERRERGWSGHGLVTIALHRVDDDLLCVIGDNGAGLPDGYADTLFMPFHTTKAKGGTGLGLHICREIVGRSGGTIEARPRAAGGAEFEIRMPVYKARPGTREPGAASGSEAASS